MVAFLVSSSSLRTAFWVATSFSSFSWFIRSWSRRSWRPAEWSFSNFIISSCLTSSFYFWISYYTFSYREAIIFTEFASCSKHFWQIGDSRAFLNVKFELFEDWWDSLWPSLSFIKYWKFSLCKASHFSCNYFNSSFNLSSRACTFSNFTFSLVFSIFT